ncbi:MAG: hypothetical protein WD875_09065 [Pirellulales bacterium]
MRTNSSRRRFLAQATLCGAVASLGDLSFLSRLGRVSAAEATLDPKIVRLAPEIEPLVRLLEDTPRERIIEVVAERVRGGLSYRELLTALMLAGVRNVEPRPSVGFKFHAVLVVNSAHLASLASPDEHRWLPIFWAIDNFKGSQARDVQEGNWTMPPVDEAVVPKFGDAKALLTKSLDAWDEAPADAAVAAMVRGASPTEVYELLFRYGARDFRAIGHKAIFVANSYRTIQCIGWRHAEPVLRSLVYAFLNHEGQDNPAKSDLPADRPWRANVELAKSIRRDWREGKPDDGATTELLSALRGGSTEELPKLIVEQINRGVATSSIWDALLVGSGEMLARQPGIVGLHTVTTTNAMRFAFENVADDDTRRMVLLQNAAFLTMFRDEMNRRGNVGDVMIDKLEPAEAGDASPDKQIETILREIGSDKLSAARRVLAYRGGDGNPAPLIDAARVAIFLKGTDAHDYKFSSAVLEDYYHVSPAWRDRLLAASMFWLRGSQAKDNSLVGRTRAALAGRT